MTNPACEKMNGVGCTCADCAHERPECEAKQLLMDIGPLGGLSTDEIHELLLRKGFTRDEELLKEKGKLIYSQKLPDGTIAAVRIDQGGHKNQKKEYRGAHAHTHKEIVLNGDVSNGYIDNPYVIPLDDEGHSRIPDTNENKEERHARIIGAK